MDVNSKSPYEYNSEHRERMRCVLEEICNPTYCEVCDKIIIKRIWSLRGCDMICCSSECVDNYSVCLNYLVSR